MKRIIFIITTFVFLPSVVYASLFTVVIDGHTVKYWTPVETTATYQYWQGIQLNSGGFVHGYLKRKSSTGGRWFVEDSSRYGTDIPSDILDDLIADVQAGVIDSDGDSVPDFQEIKDGTDPDDSSSFLNGDPMSDKDGDGFPYWQELEAGTSDNDPDDIPVDSDGDGICDAAENALGTNPDSEFSKPFDGYYPGLYDDISDGDIDGDGVLNGNDDDMDGDGISNADEAYWGSDPTSANQRPYDSDGDGFSDWTEAMYKTNPYDSNSKPPDGDYNTQPQMYTPDYVGDNNGNGINDFAEHYLGGQNLTDSDGDSYPDYIENLYGTNPSNSFDTPNYEDTSPLYGNQTGGSINPNSQTNPLMDKVSNPEPDSDLPDYTPSPDPDPEIDEPINADDTVTELTQQDIADAMQWALQNTKGSIADAVAAGIDYSGRDAVADGIYDSREAISDAVVDGLDRSWGVNDRSFSLDALGKSGDGSVGGVFSGAESRLEGLNSKLGVTDMIDVLDPDGDQTDYTLDITIPSVFTAGGNSTDLGVDLDYSISVLPDTNTDMGSALDSIRLLVRIFICLVLTWVFAKSISKTLYQLT